MRILLALCYTLVFCLAGCADEFRTSEPSTETDDVSQTPSDAQSSEDGTENETDTGLPAPQDTTSTDANNDASSLPDTAPTPDTETAEDAGEQTEDAGEQTEDAGEQTEDVGEQTEDVVQSDGEIYDDTVDPEPDAVQAVSLEASPTQVSFESFGGEFLTPALVSVSSEPAGVAFQWGELPSWLTVESLGSETPTELTLEVDPAGLPAGVHTDSFEISADGADSVTIEVTVNVTWSTWSSTEGPGVALVNSLLADPAQSGRVLAGTYGGIFLTEDFGDNWSGVDTDFENYKVSTLASTDDGSVFWAGTDSGIYRSDDGGVTWQNDGGGLGGLETWNGVTAIHVVSEDRVYAGTAKPYRTENGGESWEELGQAGGGVQSIIELDDETILVGSFANGIWRSTDNGGNFVQVHPAAGGFPTPSSISSIILDPSDGSLIASDYSFFAGNATLLKSINDGATWTTLATNVAGEIVDLAMDPNNPLNLYAAAELALPDLGESGLLKSGNGGSSWSATSLWKKGDVLTTTIDPVDSDLVMAGGAGAWVSNDGGWVFEAANTGLGASTVSSIGVTTEATGRIYAGTPGQCLWHRESSGASWVQLAAQGLPCTSTLSSILVHPDNPDHLWVTAASALHVSLDGGATFDPSGLETLSPFRILPDPSNPLQLYGACALNGIYASPNGGTNWQEMPYDASLVWVQELALSTNEEGTWLVAGVNHASHLVRHLVGTASWEAIGSGLPGIVTELAVHPSNPDIVAVHTSSSGMYWTHDGGTTWNPAIPGIADGEVRRMVFIDGDAGLVGAATDVGFYLSDSNGESYQKLSLGLAPSYLRDAAVDPLTSTVYGASVGGGLFEATWTP